MPKSVENGTHLVEIEESNILNFFLEHSVYHLTVLRRRTMSRWMKQLSQTRAGYAMAMSVRLSVC